MESEELAAEVLVSMLSSHGSSVGGETPKKGSNTAEPLPRDIFECRGEFIVTCTIEEAKTVHVSKLPLASEDQKHACSTTRGPSWPWLEELCQTTSTDVHLQYTCTGTRVSSHGDGIP